MFWPQVPIDVGSNAGGGELAPVPLPIHTFCHQISSTEFEQQKLAASQKAMEELLEMLLTDQNLSEKERHKKLKQVGWTKNLSLKKNQYSPHNSFLKGMGLFTKHAFIIGVENKYLITHRVVRASVSEAVPRNLQSTVPFVRPGEEQAKD